MAREVYRVEIPIEATDGYSREIKSAEQQVSKFEKSVERTTSRTKKRMDDLNRGRWSITINAVDKASRVASSVSSYIHRVANRSYRFTLRAFDMATRTIGGIRRAVTSIPALITIGLSVVGAGKLKDATVGAAMSFEQYEVSMTHWLEGNTKQAKELVQWMGKFADTTPFSSVELFPALTRGIGVTGGDVKQAQDLLKLSADMAAMTPGSSVSDAMEALADAQMGEMERLKAFNVKISKKEMQKIGYAGVVSQLAKKFEGGARKLSETSDGIISTLKGYRSSFFRSMGTGFLDPMKPRLQAINQWLADNQETWGRWKDTVKRHGQQTSEFIFTNLEKGFSHIRSRYLDNKQFMDLSFKGKIDFVLGDINDWWTSKGKPAVDGWWESSGKPWASKTGLTIGEAIFEGIKTGITRGLETIGDMWGDVGASARENGVFSKETAKSAGGAGVATLAAGALGAAVLSPFLKVIGGALKGGKKGVGGLYGAGRWAWGKTPGGKKSIAAPVVADKPSSGKQPTPKPSQPPKNVPVIFDHHGKPLLPSNAKPKSLPTPKVTPDPALPKTSSRILKRIPLLGTLLSIGALAGTSREEITGTVGAIGGGVVGAKGGALAGAAIGSIVPGVGTAIGAGVGGLVGGIGGAVGGEWIGNNWDLIKKNSSSAYQTVKDKWGGFPDWYENSVSTPLKNKSTDALNVVVGAYSFGKDAVQRFWEPTSSWFEGSVWNPLSEGAGITGDIIGRKFDAAKAITSAAWSPVSGWFQETVWSPLSIGAEITGGVIGERLQASYAVVQAAWGAASSWFEANVWGPLRAGVEVTAGWFQTKLDVMKAGASSMGNVVSDKTDLFKTGVKAGFNVLKNRGQQETGVKSKYANGGFINSPHIGLVGEAGPEMIIPLSSGRRNRAMELYQRTGAMLGVRAYADGGMVGVEPIVQTSNSSPVSTDGGNYASSSVSLSMPVSIEVNGANDTESIIQQVINEFGSAVIPQLREALSNMP